MFVAPGGQLPMRSVSLNVSAPIRWISTPLLDRLESRTRNSRTAVPWPGNWAASIERASRGTNTKVFMTSPETARTRRWPCCGKTPNVRPHPPARTLAPAPVKCRPCWVSSRRRTPYGEFPETGSVRFEPFHRPFEGRCCRSGDRPPRPLTAPHLRARWFATARRLRHYDAP